MQARVASGEEAATFGADFPALEPYYTQVLSSIVSTKNPVCSVLLNYEFSRCAPGWSNVAKSTLLDVPPEPLKWRSNYSENNQLYILWWNRWRGVVAGLERLPNQTA
jgi:hypothetical protein